MQTEGITKRFGDIEALCGIDLEIEAGTVFALVGPNGAGKTTYVRILSTLLRATSGRARVAGFDVRSDADAVRARIGLTGQYAAVDNDLTGRENLVMFGRLLGLGRQVAKRRAGELIERFDLVDAADRPVKGYSGGMRRRLDLSASLVGEPEIAFLDEPTTGLDPRSRLGLWAVIEELVARGMTVLLTTQYMDEADHLADRVGVIDRGRLIAQGTATELKDKIGGRVIDVEVASQQFSDAARALADGGLDATLLREDSRLSIPADGTSRITDAVRCLDRAGIEIRGLELHSPSLDDVFLRLTGSKVDI